MFPVSAPKYRIYSIVTSTKYQGWTSSNRTFLYAKMSLQSALFQTLDYKVSSQKAEIPNWWIIHSQPRRQ